MTLTYALPFIFSSLRDGMLTNSIVWPKYFHLYIQWRFRLLCYLVVEFVSLDPWSSGSLCLRTTPGGAVLMCPVYPAMKVTYNVMSWHENALNIITGPLCGESTGHISLLFAWTDCYLRHRDTHMTSLWWYTVTKHAVMLCYDFFSGFIWHAPQSSYTLTRNQKEYIGTERWIITVISPEWHCVSNHYRLDSLFYSLFSNKETVKDPYYWPLLRGFHRWPMDSPHQRRLIRKVFPCHDVIRFNGKDFIYNPGASLINTGPPRSC